MIPAIQELNFPKKNGKQYATLTHATVTLADMGEKTITTQVKIDGEIVPDFSSDWEVVFQGEKYIMPLRIPQGAKENTSLNSTIDLTFHHWAIYQLKRWPFVTMQPIQTGTAIADEEVADVQLNLKDFCDLFGQVLEYYYGNTITIDLNPAWLYDNAPTLITISHTYIWNVLINAFHDKLGVRWAIEPHEDNDNTVKGGERYVIKVGYPTTEVNHIFEYGFEGGLLKLERQVQSEEIRNMIKGRGGETNIPFCYFKNTDPNNKDFRPDPDWVEELKNIYFTNLMPATFRSYIQGWKAAHISKYPGYKAVGESNAYAPWAYRKGYTDTKFHPVEFVADEIITDPGEGDRRIDILPGFSPFIKKGSSLDKYGPLPATLDNNDEIYPTIQGTGLDVAVAVEQIKSDDVESSAESDAILSELSPIKGTAVNVPKGGYETITIDGGDVFHVDKNKYATLGVSLKVAKVTENGKVLDDLTTAKVYGTPKINVYNAITGTKRSASGIPEGEWRYEVIVEVRNLTTNKTLNITVEDAAPKLTDATLSEGWSNTFDIWVKNIWNTSKLSTETDSQYAERVWKPVLGDRQGNKAKIVFTSGALVHEDYEFTIVDFPVPDKSKSYKGELSHWRIKLAKSNAELEVTGLYVPSTQKQGKAGDTFVFIGTEMTHVPYVVNAEIALDDWKKDHLGEVKEIKPTLVVTTDRVRLNNEGRPNALINQLRVGNSLRIADKRFIQPIGNRAYETLYLQSLTYTFREPSSDDTALNPDVEIVLSNEYATSANPVSIMQGDISSMQRLLGSISNVEQIVRAVGDKLYLRKDGISDRSLSPTQFFSLLTSGDFRAGLVGGAGWGFYKDENGNWVLEADRLKARQDFEVNTLVINQAEGRGGMEIDTAAFMEVTRVVETDNGYVCYFDQKDGSVANLFRVDDVAYCNRWSPENTELKFYKRRVVAVGVDNITLTKERTESSRPADWTDSGVNGTGIPTEKDNIIHFGNYNNKERQYVKVRDVVGGGYERYIEELNSVNASGVEYYFVGKQAGKSRWFVGNKDLVPYSGKGDGSYIEYIDGKFNLNNVRLSVGSTIGDKTFQEYIQDQVGDVVSPLAEYSVTGEDGSWHPVYEPSDLFMRFSADGGKTWDGPMRISAKDGQPGKDGRYRKSQWAIGSATSETEPWQDTPLNAPAGQYVWMRSGVVIPPATEPSTYDTPIRLTGDKGADGDSVYMLDLSNEIAAVACNSSGTVTGTYPTSTASVYKGGKKITSGVTYSIAQKTGISTANISTSGVITMSDMTATRAEITVQAKVSGLTLTAVMTLYKVIPGINGDSAVTYEITPSVDSITKSIDGSLSAETVNCAVYKVTGNSPRVLTSEMTLRYRRMPDGDNGTLSRTNGVSMGVAILPDTEAIIFELYQSSSVFDDSTLLDRERVPVITDASGIELGGVNLLLGTQDWSGDNWSQLPVLTESDISEWAGTVAIKNNKTMGPLQAYTSAIEGEQYTFSFWIKVSSGVSSITLVFAGAVDTNPIQLVDKVVPNQWIRLHATYTAKSHINTPMLRIQHAPTTDVWLAGYKLERGNVPTDWSKNPADNDTKKFNYLLAAMKDGNTIITNALVQTSVVALGKFDEEGKGEIWAGTNGLYRDGNTPAIWAGGDMEDAEYSKAERAAKFLVRMDGTGYAAGNTVKFNQSQLKVGDKTIMDKDGFAFVIPSGTQGQPDTEILRIANMEVGDLNSYLTPVVGTINVGPYSRTLTIASGTDGFTVNGVFQYNISHSMFKAGATLNMSVQVLMFLSNVDFNVPTDPWAVYSKPTLNLRIMDNTTKLPIFEDSQVVEPVKTDMSYFFNINTVLPTTGTYTLIVSFSNGVPPTSATSYNTSMSVTIVGNSYVSSGQRVLIAPNGVAIAKKNTLIFSNENEVVLRAGKFVFRIDNANGFSYSSNGGASNSWRPIGWT